VCWPSPVFSDISAMRISMLGMSWWTSDDFPTPDWPIRMSVWLPMVFLIWVMLVWFWVLVRSVVYPRFV